ncbi:MAG: acyloxyacyl hydrolase [Kiritimatiellia bacterium]
MRGFVVLMLAGLALNPMFAAPAPAAFAADPPLLSIGIGVAQVFDNHQEFFWGVEYRPAFRWFHVGPWFLFGTGKNDEFYAAGGVLADVELGRDWVLTPSFGAGYYSASGGLDLGFDAEFRTAVELAKRFGNGQRLGLCFAHLSNGSLSDENPGTETLGISYSLPLDFLFRRGPAVAVPERTE